MSASTRNSGHRRQRRRSEYGVNARNRAEFRLIAGGKSSSKFCGSPAWIRTTIHGSKGRCPTIRRPGKLSTRLDAYYFNTLLRRPSLKIKGFAAQIPLLSDWFLVRANAAVRLDKPGDVHRPSRLGSFVIAIQIHISFVAFMVATSALRHE